MNLQNTSQIISSYGSPDYLFTEDDASIWFRCATTETLGADIFVDGRGNKWKRAFRVTWVPSGSDVVYSAGNVMIGTGTPRGKLDVDKIFIGTAGVTHGVMNTADGLYFNADSDANGAGNAYFYFGRGRTGEGVGGVNFVKISDNGLEVLTGPATITNLAGTGSRPVFSSAAGALSAPALLGDATKYLDSTGNYSTPIGGSRVMLASDVANSTTSLADVTALSFAVTSGVTYKFKFVIVYSAAATSTGSRWSINGPATTLLAYKSEYGLTLTSRTFNESVGAYDTPAAGNATSPATTNNMSVVEGIIKPSSSGNVIARFASAVGASAITAKGGLSYVEYQVIN